MRFRKQTDTKKTIKLSEKEKEKEYVSLVYGSEKQFNENVQKISRVVNGGNLQSGKSYSDSRSKKDISRVKARTILENFKEGYVNFNGVKINTSQDVADLYTLPIGIKARTESGDMSWGI